MKHLSKLFTAGATLLSLVGCSIDVPYTDIPYQSYTIESGIYLCGFDEKTRRERGIKAPQILAECDPREFVIGERYNLIVDSSVFGDKVVSHEIAGEIK